MTKFTESDIETLAIERLQSLGFDEEHMQLGFLDIDTRHAKLSQYGDPLERLNQVIKYLPCARAMDL